MGPLENPKHELAVQKRLQGVTAADAYQAAYPNSSRESAETAGPRLFRNVQVQARMRELKEKVAEAVVAKTGVTETQVVAELANLAFSDIRNVMKWGSGGVELLDSAGLTQDTAASVASIRQSATGAMSVTMHDKIGALKALLDRFPPAQSDVLLTPNVNGPFIDAPPRETYEQWEERVRNRRDRESAGASKPSID
jgi:hypothetical protein